LRSFRRIIRAIDIHSRRLATDHQITGPQLLCLNFVIEEGTVTATQLSQLVHLSTSTIVGILDRLEQKGLIHRERDAKDRRVVRVTATDSGRELITHAPSPLQDTMVRALQRLSPLEQSTIALSLERVVELMEAEDIDAAPVLETGAIERTAPPPPGDASPSV